MNPPEHSDPEQEEAPAFRILRAAGIPARRLEYRYHPAGGIRDAAGQLDLPARTIIKTLVFTPGSVAPEDSEPGTPVIALMHGDSKVALRKLERLAGIRHLRPCSPQEAEAMTGYKTGGISPFGLPGHCLICIQESLRKLEAIAFNAGARGVVAVTAPDALNLLAGRWGDCAGRPLMI